MDEYEQGTFGIELMEQKSYVVETSGVGVDSHSVEYFGLEHHQWIP